MNTDIVRRLLARLGFITLVVNFGVSAPAGQLKAGTITKSNEASLPTKRPDLDGSNHTVQIVDLDVSKISQALERPRSTGANSSVTIGGTKFNRSLSTRAPSRLCIELDGRAKTFYALAGVSDDAKNSTYSFRGTVGEVRFRVLGDGKLLDESPLVGKGQPAVSVQANLQGVHELILEVDGPPGAFANWVQAQIIYTQQQPKTVLLPELRAISRVTVQPPEPRIHGATVIGIRPEAPFLQTIAVTGDRPLHFTAKGLPKGLNLDSTSGIIRGSIAKPGHFEVVVTAQNSVGQDVKTIHIESSDRLALTPPMGWNSWNVTEGLVSETVLEEMADAMVSEGLRDVGYQYIDLDDEYVVGRDPSGAPEVDPVRFPHGMKAVADYLHARGLKLGIYSSPGPTTCGGSPGTMGHERIDLKTWISWDVDLVKYDLCSTPKSRSSELYTLMGNLLQKSSRSIVYCLCGPPASLGLAAKAQMWRTAGDIRDMWHLPTGDGLIDCFDVQSAPGRAEVGGRIRSQFQHPGGWDDPDLLLVGIYGKGASSNDEGATGCNDIEYQTQMSLWSLRSAPLLITADLRTISPSALEILGNPEIIDVDQDPLGREPALVSQTGGMQSWTDVGSSELDKSTPEHQKYEVWVKEMADGSKVVALLNRSEQLATITAQWKDIGASGRQRLRDLWRRKDLGLFIDKYSSSVPPHGTVMIRLWSHN